nr:hypothetical protein [Tanacetum cinerariifolium]
MACSLSHTDSEVEALVQKLIDEDKGRQNTILDLALQFKNSCTAKDDIRNACVKCNDISQESCALIDNFLKEGSDKDYELNLSMYGKAAKLEKQMDANARVEPSPYTPNPVSIIPGHAGIVQLSSSTCVEPSSSTLNPVRIIPGPMGVVQRAKLLRENVFILDSDGALMSTQEYMQKVAEDVGEDDDFNSGAWFSATNYVIATVTSCLGHINNFLKKGKLEQVVAIVKSCFSNVLGDLNVTMKDLSGTIPETVHYKVIGDGGYEKDITVRAAMILDNVSVFTLKPREQQQLAQDEKAYREYLEEEEATAEKERARVEKEWEEEMKKEEAHNQLFRLWGPSEEIWQATILHTLSLCFTAGCEREIHIRCVLVRLMVNQIIKFQQLLPHARGLEFKLRRGGFPSGAKKEWALSPKANVRVLHTAQLDVTVSSNH